MIKYKDQRISTCILASITTMKEIIVPLWEKYKKHHSRIFEIVLLYDFLSTIVSYMKYSRKSSENAYVDDLREIELISWKIRNLNIINVGRLDYRFIRRLAKNRTFINLMEEIGYRNCNVCYNELNRNQFCMRQDCIYSHVLTQCT